MTTTRVETNASSQPAEANLPAGLKEDIKLINEKFTMAGKL